MLLLGAMVLGLTGVQAVITFMVAVFQNAHSLQLTLFRHPRRRFQIAKAFCFLPRL